MNDYIDIFKIEAKGLLKDFKKRDKKAVERCAKYFSGHDDLSLMNVQHVIAKEYGFNNWEDVTKAENWELATALNIAQDKTLTSSLFPKDAKEKNRFYSYGEKGSITPSKPREGMDFVNFREVFSNGYTMDIFQINGLDVSEYDLSKLDISKTVFDEITVWPNDINRLPKDYNPHRFLEERKNPGLNIRELHKQGIDGNGRNVAIIDPQAVRPHMEYRNNLVDYVDVCPQYENHAAQGGEYISALVGKTCGVIPKAKIYYFKVEANRSQQGYADALNQICSIHQNLLNQGKNGIDVVWIQRGLLSELFTTEVGHDEFVKAYEKATQMGIWVNISGNEPEKEYKPIMQLMCKANGDVNNPQDYVNCSNWKMPQNAQEHVKKHGVFLALPSKGRTVGISQKLTSYQYDAMYAYDKSISSGLYVMAKSVKENITPAEFWQLMYDTGDEIMDGLAIIPNPQKLISVLKE